MQKGIALNDIEVVIHAPEECSLISSPELTIAFFNKAGMEFRRGKNVMFDLTNTTSIDEGFAAVLISHIKDRNINEGRVSKLLLPKNEECNRKLKRFGIFKKVNSKNDQRLISNTDTQKVTNVLVANDVAKGIVNAATLVIYGYERRIKELYALLIEIMANTNNHAAIKETGIYPWWLFVFPNLEEKTVKFIFLDLGVGIFESIPVKKYMYNNPHPLMSTERELFRIQRGNELSKVFSALIAGKIKSSTGLATRGKGIPLISDSAKSGHFQTFFILSNDAYVDVVNTSVSCMAEKFSGTLFCFELKECK